MQHSACFADVNSSIHLQTLSTQRAREIGRLKDLHKDGIFGMRIARWRYVPMPGHTFVLGEVDTVQQIPGRIRGPVRRNLLPFGVCN